jgi:hypothetical protein
MQPEIFDMEHNFSNSHNVEGLIADDLGSIPLGDAGGTRSDNSGSEISVIANVPPSSASEMLDIRDLISDHISAQSTGGYLQFTANDGVVTLGLDLTDANGSGNSTYIPLATIEGASGLNGSQILNTLLANHEIKFD